MGSETTTENLFSKLFDALHAEEALQQFGSHLQLQPEREATNIRIGQLKRQIRSLGGDV